MDQELESLEMLILFSESCEQKYITASDIRRYIALRQAGGTFKQVFDQLMWEVGSV